MPKYRKTALVDAEQFLPPENIPAGCYQAGGIADVSAGHGEWKLRTLEGEHDLRPGDYICTGPAGERWNVEKSIFEATYEPAMTNPTEATILRAGGWKCGCGVANSAAAKICGYCDCERVFGEDRPTEAEQIERVAVPKNCHLCDGAMVRDGKVWVHGPDDEGCFLRLQQLDDADDIAHWNDVRQALHPADAGVTQAQPWHPISEGFAVLKDAICADQRKPETWPRISPGEAQAIRRDFAAGRTLLAGLSPSVSEEEAGK